MLLHRAIQIYTEATASKPPFWKWGDFKQGNLKCPICYVLNFIGWIKLIYIKVVWLYCVKDEFNLSFQFLTMVNGSFQIVPFGNTPFPKIAGLSALLGSPPIARQNANM